jgi:hypothetical protein
VTAIPYDRNVLVWTLVQHQRMDSRHCLCGWEVWGKSHAAHVAEQYEKSDALRLIAAAEPEPPDDVDPDTLEALLAWLYPDPERPCSCDHKRLPAGLLHGVDMGHDWVRTSTNPDCWHHGTAAQAHYKACQDRFKETGDWNEFHKPRQDP